MLITRDTKTGERILKTGITDLEGTEVTIVDMEGYGSMDIALPEIAGIRFSDIPELIEALKLAERVFKE